MKKNTFAFILTVLVVCGLDAGLAPASSDCSSLPTFYALLQPNRDYFSPYDPISVPFLAPTNDSRVTLMLLLFDAGLARPRLPKQAEYAQTINNSLPFFEIERLCRPGKWRDAPISPYWAETPLDSYVIATMFMDKPVVGDGLSQDESWRYAAGEGNVCRNVPTASDDFLKALKASEVPASEQAILADARARLNEMCSGNAAKPSAVAVQSAAAKEFAAYLEAAAAFYDFARGMNKTAAVDAFNAAHGGFAALMTSKEPWLQETANYMVARVDLTWAQRGLFGQYGELRFENVSAETVAAAEAALRAYLRAYPGGRYAVSARGLLRRVDWLGHDHAKLAAEFTQAFAVTDPAMRNVSLADLVYEADNKLLTQTKLDNIHEPWLLATLDLMLMRRPRPKSEEDKPAPPPGPAPLTRQVLEAQRADFAERKDLFNYLLAAYAFYAEDKPSAALRLLEGAEPKADMTFLRFSEQVLKGLALEADKKAEAARAHWLALIPLVEPVLQRPAVELALAQNYEKSGELDAVFAPNSPILNPTYREILLVYGAGPALLRQRTRAADASERERQVALYVLLIKELMHGDYQTFLDDLRLMPATTAPAAEREAYDKFGSDGKPPALGDFNWPGTDKAGGGFTCPSLRDIVSVLARDQHDARSRLCLGEFLRLKGYDDFLRIAIDPPTPSQLGGVAAQFPSEKRISRLDFYEEIIADPKAAKDVRAYALYRAVYCWAPTGVNGCDDSDLAVSQRRRWFNELKSKYPDTVWAKELKYYW